MSGPSLFAMKNQPPNFYLGVEWVGDQIRAAVWDEQWRLQGKASRSDKTQRGLGEVLKRIARCALDAVDEADRQPEDIVASAVLTNGHKASQTWGPLQVNQLAHHLPPKMGSNLLTGGRVATIMWEVCEHEFSGRPRAWLGLFTEPEPALYAAERTQPGATKLIPSPSAGPTSGAAGLAGLPVASAHLLAAIDAVQPEVLLLVGPAHEDGKAPVTRQLSEWLSSSGLKLPVHIPGAGAQVGTWAAARLAARTFMA